VGTTVLAGDAKFEASQDVPDFPMRNAHMLGWKNVIDKPEDISVRVERGT
jgi:hypothetical protein